jgi:hypothetical protein
MKWSYFLIILTFNSALWARDREILKCLGEEEKRFHLKKETGPIYDLNQRLIAEIIQVPKVELVKEHFLTICSGENFSESWKLLELSIKLGKNIFIIPSNVTGIQRSMTEGMIEDYVEATREILLGTIAQIQSISPTPNCLKEEIPELDQFFNEIKYLQEDIDTKKIFEGKDQKIFEKLKNYPLAFEKCRARLKKKLKSESKAAPKKR